MDFHNLKICFMGGKQAGIAGFLTVLSRGCKVVSAVSYSDDLTDVLALFKVPIHKSINDRAFIQNLHESDLLLSVHGKEISKPDLLKLPRLGAINVHPYLYKYKGANSVQRALEDKEFKASVGVHVMEEKIDRGRVITEKFVDVSGARSVEEVYNRLYSCYTAAIVEALELICNE